MWDPLSLFEKNFLNFLAIRKCEAQTRPPVPPSDGAQVWASENVYEYSACDYYLKTTPVASFYISTLHLILSKREERKKKRMRRIRNDFEAEMDPLWMKQSFNYPQPLVHPFLALQFFMCSVIWKNTNFIHAKNKWKERREFQQAIKIKGRHTNKRRI